MSTIQIKNLSFAYPGAAEPVFNNVSLTLDTHWRLGLIGRNGRGKTTFLRLLLGQLHGQGEILAQQPFDYFPVKVLNEQLPAGQAARALVAPFDEWEKEMQHLIAQNTPEALERYGEVEQAYALEGGYTVDETITAEAGKLGIGAQVLARPFDTLSGGERVKLMLAALFLKRHHFLLIDEPTDHLDANGRKTVAKWLAGKSGFILVSHDRQFLDEAVDHILAVNKNSIELQKGNYTSWHTNKTQQDNFEMAQNKKLQQSIGRLQQAAAQASRWSDKTEKSKFGASTQKGAPPMVDKGYIGHKAAKMMQRSKSLERRKEKEIEEKKQLLKDVEQASPLMLNVLQPEKKELLVAEEIAFGYAGKPLFAGVSFTVQAGRRIAVTGRNGCGKSSLLKLILGAEKTTQGQLRRMGNLVISYLPQETSFLQGNLLDFAAQEGLAPSLFLTILRKLNFERDTFEQPMQLYSKGQKKKVCIAAGMAKSAHLFVWDEPLNYIDILSREQIETAILASNATMIFVEHDGEFAKKVATDWLCL